MKLRSARSGMRRAAALSIVFCGVAAGIAPVAAQTSDFARGMKIVEAKCARCHATGRSDASPNPKAPPFRDVAKLYPVEHLAEALAEGIVTGDNDMPEFKFGPKDIDAIIDYLNTMSSSR